MTAQIIKSQSVMNLSLRDSDDGVVGFTNGDPGTEDETKAYVMVIEDWEAFGRPTTITVTVEPGDLLNVEGAQ